MRPPPGPLASPRAERVVGGLRSGARVGRYLPRDRRCARRGCAEGGERTPGCLRPTGSLRTALPRRRQQRRSAGADPPSSFLSVARPGEMSAFPWAVSWGGRSILMIPRHKSAAFSTPAPAARSFRPTRRVSAAMEASPGSPALWGGGIMVDTGEWGAPNRESASTAPPGRAGPRAHGREGAGAPHRAGLGAASRGQGPAGRPAPQPPAGAARPLASPLPAAQQWRARRGPHTLPPSGRPHPSRRRWKEGSVAGQPRSDSQRRRLKAQRGEPPTLNLDLAQRRDSPSTRRR